MTDEDTWEEDALAMAGRAEDGDGAEDGEYPKDSGVTTDLVEASSGELNTSYYTTHPCPGSWQHHLNITPTPEPEPKPKPPKA